uniref:Uncharacterized protein n=1 Tax=Anguilla anguilla TaxID=7936 RepID=A0A0E9S588_ANGAN
MIIAKTEMDSPNHAEIRYKNTSQHVKHASATLHDSKNTTNTTNKIIIFFKLAIHLSNETKRLIAKEGITEVKKVN